MRFYPVLLLCYQFEIMEMEDGHVAVCVGESAEHFHGMIKLDNDSAVFMFKLLQKGITLPELIMACMNEFKSDVDTTGPIVMEFLDSLRDQGLLMADASHGVKDEREEQSQQD